MAAKRRCTPRIVVQVKQDDPRAEARGFVVSCDPLAQLPLAVLSIDWSRLSAHLLNHAAHRRFIDDLLGCRTHHNRGRIGYPSIAKERQLLRVGWSGRRDDRFGQ